MRNAQLRCFFSQTNIVHSVCEEARVPLYWIRSIRNGDMNYRDVFTVSPGLTGTESISEECQET